MLNRMNDIPEYIEDILSMGIVKGFLQMSVSVIDGEKIYKFKEDGYVNLVKLEGVSITSILNFFKEINSLIMNGEEYLLFSNDYILNESNIYISKDMLKVAIKYVPCEKKNNTLDLKLKGLIKLFKEKTMTENITYLDNLEIYSDSVGYDLISINKEIEKMLLEIKFCQVDDSNGFFINKNRKMSEIIL